GYMMEPWTAGRGSRGGGRPPKKLLHDETVLPDGVSKVQSHRWQRLHSIPLPDFKRYLACEKAGVEPTFTDFEGDDAAALALVISLNAQRRDLTAAQRAMVAARMTNTNRGRPSKNRTDSATFSIDDASKRLKVGVNQV